MNSVGWSMKTQGEDARERAWSCKPSVKSFA